MASFRKFKLLLYRPLVLAYYQKNIVFYLVIYLFAFGFLRSPEHVQLGKVIVSKLDLLLGAGLLWALHVLKTSLFIHQSLKLPQYRYLIEFNLLSKPRKTLELAGIQFILNLPFLSYGLFWALLALSLNDIRGLLIVVLLNLVLIVLPVFWLGYRFEKFLNFTESSISSFTVNLWPKTKSLWFLRFLLHQDALRFVTTKVFSFLLIWGISSLYSTDEYDHRLLYLMAFFVGVGHIVLGKSYREFTGEQTTILRNLPSLALQRSFELFLTSISLVAIECFFVFRYLPQDLSIQVAIACSLLIFAMQYFWLCLAFYNKGYSETFGMRFYLFSALVLVLIMYGLTGLHLAIVFLVLGAFLSSIFYEKFEYQT